MNDKLLTKKFMNGGDVMESQYGGSGPGKKRGGNRGTNRRRKRAVKKCKRKGCGAKVRYRV